MTGSFRDLESTGVELFLPFPSHVQRGEVRTHWERSANRSPPGEEKDFPLRAQPALGNFTRMEPKEQVS